MEIDSDSHFNDNAREYDKIRSEYLNSLDIEVVRFTNTEVMRNMMGVCHVLSGIIDQRLEEQSLVNIANIDNPL